MEKSKINRLMGTKSYLSGAIDRCPDLGITWRKWLTKEIGQRYGIISYNPLEKPIDIADEHEYRQVRKRWKEEGKYKELSDFITIIKNVDRRMCSKSDFGIFYLDMDIFACGTLRELFWMLDDNKPIILLCKQGKKHIPDWLFSEVPLEFIKEDWDDVFKYLDKINDGFDDGTNRWMIFDY